MEEENKKPVTLFGKDISDIPCFRNSWLYGISGGIGSSLLCFLFTSKPKVSTHVGFTGMVVITMSYWSYCRYDIYYKERELQKVKDYIERRSLLEATEMEKLTSSDVREV